METILYEMARWNSNPLTETTVKLITYTITTNLVVQNLGRFLTLAKK